MFPRIRIKVFRPFYLSWTVCRYRFVFIATMAVCHSFAYSYGGIAYGRRLFQDCGCIRRPIDNGSRVDSSMEAGPILMLCALRPRYPIVYLVLDTLKRL